MLRVTSTLRQHRPGVMDFRKGLPACSCCIVDSSLDAGAHKLREAAVEAHPASMRSLLQIIALATLSLSLGVAGIPAPVTESKPALVKRADPQGCDVSNYQGSSLNWATIKSEGVQFTYIKATEGTSKLRTPKRPLSVDID
jgi:GH25 family lysozyme M1 (1,4-beta-N-acetylmuramidase)